MNKLMEKTESTQYFQLNFKSQPSSLRNFFFLLCAPNPTFHWEYLREKIDILCIHKALVVFYKSSFQNKWKKVKDPIPWLEMKEGRGVEGRRMNSMRLLDVVTESNGELEDWETLCQTDKQIYFFDATASLQISVLPIFISILFIYQLRMADSEETSHKSFDFGELTKVNLMDFSNYPSFRIIVVWSLKTLVHLK